jgi:predicted nuclease with TOPRIM domain
MSKKIVSILLALFLLSSPILASPSFGLTHTGFVVYVSPQHSSARINQVVSINISVANVSSPGLWAYELKIFYNTSLLEPISANIPEDHFLKPTLSPNNIFIIDNGKINNTEGSISFAATLLGEEIGKTGSGTLANVTFIVTATGTAAITIGGYITPEPKFVDGNGNTISSCDYTIQYGYVECLLPLPPPIPPPPPTPGKQTLTFNFVGIYGYLTYPEEGHPNDRITYQILVAAEPSGIHLNYIKINLICNITIGQRILYNETIENMDLPETWLLNKSIVLTIPDNALGKIYCSIEVETKRAYVICDSAIGVYTTFIRKMTYEELQVAYQQLLDQYNATIKELQQWMDEYQSLNLTYYQLLDLYNTTMEELEYWRSEYHKINETYYELLSQHNATLEQLSYWMNEYGRLNNTYNQLLKNYTSLNSNYQKLQSDYNSLKSMYDSLEASYRSLNASYNSLKSNYDLLQENYKDLQEKYNSLNSTYQELKINYNNLMLSFEELKSNLTLLQTQYDSLLESYSALNSTYYALLEEYDGLKSRENALMREVWMTRALGLIVLAAVVIITVYIIYSTKKKKVEEIS